MINVVVNLMIVVATARIHTDTSVSADVEFFVDHLDVLQ